MYQSIKTFLISRSRLLLPSLLLAILVSSSLYMPALAQQESSDRYTMMLRNVTLEEALEQLVVTTGMNLLYDPALVEEAKVFCNVRGETAEKILRCIIRNADLDFYRLSSGTYVLINQAQAEPQYGDFSGIVVDIETGEPLPYANVFLTDASTGTAANSAGMFSFASLLKGPHAIVATYVGYEPALDSVWVPANGKVRRQIALKPSMIVSNPIVVNGLQQRMPSADLGAGQLSKDQFTGSSFQGTDDVVYGVTSITSVGIRPPYMDLHIQGGESSEHQMQLDGVPVFEPVSLGRLLGAFSPLAVKRLTVHKAGFGASIGSQLGGIVSIEQDLEIRDRDNLTLQVDPLSANARVKWGLKFKGQAEGKFMVAGRTSVWDVYQSTALNNMLQDWNAIDPQLTATALQVEPVSLRFTPHRHGSDVSFTDLHASGQVSLNPFHKIYFSAYEGSNDVSTELLSAAASSVSDASFIALSRDKYRWTNSTMLFRHEWLFGARTMGIFRISNSRHTMQHNYALADSDNTPLPENPDVPTIERVLEEALDASILPDDRNRIRETTVSAQLDYSASTNHHLETGIEFTDFSNRFNLDSPFYVRLQQNNSAWRTAIYAQDKVALNLNTTLELGSRFTYVQGRKELYVEPRLALRYDGKNSNEMQYAFQFAAGLYRQYVNQFDLSSVGPSAAVPTIRFWLPVDGSVAPPKAWHFTANALFLPTDRWKVRLESYYKHQPHLLDFHVHTLLVPGTIDSNEPVSESEFIEHSNGFAYGAGVFLERQYKKGQWNVSYSYSQAKRTYPGLFEERLETTPWNEPHRISLNHSHALSSKLSTSLRAYGIWGRKWGFRKAYYDYLAAHRPEANEFRPFDLTQPSQHKLAPYYQLDAGVTYNATFSSVNVQLRAEVLNLLNRKNVVDWSFLNPADPTLPLGKIDRTMPGITTAISLRIQL